MRPETRIGTQIAGYRIEAMIGQGGMGEVYLAEHQTLGRMEAIKVLSADLSHDEGFRKRFQREARLAASLRHPNIIPVYDAGESNGSLYLVMPYIRGTDLRRLIDERKELDPEQALRILDGVASALDAAHGEGLVHRDVKPANILIEARDGHVYLTDFGVTRHMDSKTQLTPTGRFMGTLHYVAPEQIEGKAVDARTDVYSLGCVLYECFTGVVPYQRESEGSMLWAHLSESPPRLTDRRPDLPRAIDLVIARAMAKRKEDRYDTCTELMQAAHVALAPDTVEAPVVAPSSAPPTGQATVESVAPEVAPASAPEPAEVASSGPDSTVGREAPVVPAAASAAAASTSASIEAGAVAVDTPPGGQETVTEAPTSGERETMATPSGETGAMAAAAAASAAVVAGAVGAVAETVAGSTGAGTVLEQPADGPTVVEPATSETVAAAPTSETALRTPSAETVARVPTVETVAKAPTAEGAVAEATMAAPSTPETVAAAPTAETAAAAPSETLAASAAQTMAAAPATVPAPPAGAFGGGPVPAPPVAFGMPATVAEDVITPPPPPPTIADQAIPRVGGGPPRRPRRRLLLIVVVALVVVVAAVAVAIAVGGGGKGGATASPSASASASTPTGVVPAAPSGLTATAHGATRADLAWTDNSNNEDGFKVFEGTTVVASTAANATSFTVDSLKPGTKHCYQVAAFKGGDVSAKTTPPACVTLAATPSTPTAVRATAVDEHHIRITWKDTSSDETGFRIVEKNKIVGTVGANHTSFLAGNLTAGTKHCYQVASVNHAGASDRSALTCATTPKPTPTTAPPSSQPPPTTQPPSGGPPATPTGVHVSCSTSSCTVGWNASSGATSYTVSGSGHSASTSGTSVTFTGLDPGTTYCFTVVAHNSSGSSGGATSCGSTS